ncbi:MAG: hypothetical protein HUK02_10455 [Bacteroidaceae bacterium]|nr:hypothetical protein [Bacteroidaceae bacterium]
MGKNKANSALVESILDINANNIWNLDEYQVAQLWEADKKEEDFSSSEEKLLNIIRLAFEVVHYRHDVPREADRYENGDWSIFSHANEKKGYVAIRRRRISRITDLSYENVKHIDAPLLLELIDRNFGGGWDSIPLSLRDIILSGFDVSTTQLPTSRIHAPGGTLERKLAAGFEVLEIAKGTWTEAIFAKKKEWTVVTEVGPETDDDAVAMDEDREPMSEIEYYSSFIEEAKGVEDDEEDNGGLTIADTLDEDE